MNGRYDRCERDILHFNRTGFLVEKLSHPRNLIFQFDKKVATSRLQRRQITRQNYSVPCYFSRLCVVTIQVTCIYTVSEKCHTIRSLPAAISLTRTTSRERKNKKIGHGNANLNYYYITHKLMGHYSIKNSSLSSFGTSEAIRKIKRIMIQFRWRAVNNGICITSFKINFHDNCIPSSPEKRITVNNERAFASFTPTRKKESSFLFANTTCMCR